MSFVLVALLTALYVAMMGFFTFGLLRAKRRPGNRMNRPSVSVVVPLHNEEIHVLGTLRALEKQDYEGEWEIICVDDRSTDATGSMLEEYCAGRPRFTVLHVPHNAPPLPSPKKRALETGFQVARFEILMTMDADCIPPAGWISSMASCFSEGIGIVQGPKANFGSNRPLHSYQKLDTLGLTLIEAAGFSLGAPMVASAAALAYRKQLFFDVGGFGNLMHLVSGDDDMLVHKMSKLPGAGTLYNMDPDAVVGTAPVDTWKGLLNQRARWSSNGTQYENRLYTLFLTLIYSFLCFLCLAPLLVLSCDWEWSWFLIPLTLKTFSDLLFLGIGAFKLSSLRLLWWLPFVEIVQTPLIVAAVPLGLFRIFRWK